MSSARATATSCRWPRDRTRSGTSRRRSRAPTRRSRTAACSRRADSGTTQRPGRPRKMLATASRSSQSPCSCHTVSTPARRTWAGPGRHRAAVEQHLARLGVEHPGDGPDQGGLARPVPARHGDDLTRGDLEADLTEHGKRTVALGKPADFEQRGPAAGLRRPAAPAHQHLRRDARQIRLRRRVQAVSLAHHLATAHGLLARGRMADGGWPGQDNRHRAGRLPPRNPLQVGGSGPPVMPAGEARA